MKLAIVDPLCDAREFQRSPARRALLHVLLGDGSVQIDYYSNEDISGQVLDLGFEMNGDAGPRFAGVPSYNPLWSKSLTFRRWDEIGRKVLRRHLALERRAKSLGCKMLVDQVAAKLRRSQKAYDAVIAVSDMGLVASEGARPDCPLVYYSLEVYCEGHPHINWDDWRIAIKERERAQFRKVDVLIIQDEERARLMFADMGQPFDRAKYLQLPVTHPGSARKTRSDYLRRLHPPLQDKKILLQQNVGWPRRSEEIARMAAQVFSNDFAIVFNGTGFGDQPARYIQHDRFLDYKDLDMLVASADIGLIFYLDDNQNDSLISHASGQLSHFAQLGVPVITSYASSLERLIDKYHCGIVVRSVNDIYSAASRIMKDYEGYCAGAIACFNAEYDLANYGSEILKRLKAVRLPH